MKREIITTADGSTSIYLPAWEETYHSKHGAVQEAMHVFIKNGLQCFPESATVSILEIGFGTGLNAYLTYFESLKYKQTIQYVGVEAFPVSQDEISKMNFSENDVTKRRIFESLHSSDWENIQAISSHFSLCKQQKIFQEIADVNAYDLIYFDAFGYRVQPELWSESIFKQMYTALKDKGILVTYACRGPIKRAMLAAGFTIEILPGPPGKREMIRASKN